jgi:hypothetical protein
MLARLTLGQLTLARLTRTLARLTRALARLTLARLPDRVSDPGTDDLGPADPGLAEPGPADPVSADPGPTDPCRPILAQTTLSRLTLALLILRLSLARLKLTQLTLVRLTLVRLALAESGSPDTGPVGTGPLAAGTVQALGGHVRGSSCGGGLTGGRGRRYPPRVPVFLCPWQGLSCTWGRTRRRPRHCRSRRIQLPGVPRRPSYAPWCGSWHCLAVDAFFEPIVRGAAATLAWHSTGTAILDASRQDQCDQGVSGAVLPGPADRLL